MTELVHLTMKIPKSLRNELKKVAIDEGRTVKEIVTELITEYINETKK